MSSRHLKTTVFVKSREEIEWHQKTFLRIFLPFVPLGSARGLASGCGSRGHTPLHRAADKGHDSVVERLLEAKAEVDVQNKDSHGLGGGFRCEVNEDVDGSLMVQLFCGYCFTQFFGKRVKTLARFGSESR